MSQTTVSNRYKGLQVNGQTEVDKLRLNDGSSRGEHQGTRVCPNSIMLITDKKAPASLGG